MMNRPGCGDTTGPISFRREHWEGAIPPVDHCGRQSDLDARRSFLHQHHA
jgi:hypothetical protein